ncbi:MAG: hypothetical protein NUV77_06915, partial [Thermoguttaceae bacterium]|nr:hypothetical protein [Thermoguttaceae bacterium]
MPLAQIDQFGMAALALLPVVLESGLGRFVPPGAAVGLGFQLLARFGGGDGAAEAAFDAIAFGAATTVGIALIT